MVSKHRASHGLSQCAGDLNGLLPSKQEIPDKGERVEVHVGHINSVLPARVIGVEVRHGVPRLQQAQVMKGRANQRVHVFN